MATIPASENEFPEVLFAEGAAPGTPAAGLVKAYAKADGLLYSKDDAGVETALGGGDAAAHIADTGDAHDASAISVLDTAANFTGADVEAVLAELQDNIDGVGGGGLSSGTSFPGTPADDDLFYRTDLSCGLYRYEATGTKWVCATLHDLEWTDRVTTTAGAFTASVATWRNGVGIPLDTDMWLEEMIGALFVVSPNTGAAYWTVELSTLTVANSATQIAQLSTVSNTADNWVAERVTIGAVISSSTPAFRMGVTKVSTPGGLFPAVRVTWRHCVDV